MPNSGHGDHVPLHSPTVCGATSSQWISSTLEYKGITLEILYHIVTVAKLRENAEEHALSTCTCTVNTICIAHNSRDVGSTRLLGSYLMASGTTDEFYKRLS